MSIYRTEMWKQAIQSILQSRCVGTVSCPNLFIQPRKQHYHNLTARSARLIATEWGLVYVKLSRTTNKQPCLRESPLTSWPHYHNFVRKCLRNRFRPPPTHPRKSSKSYVRGYLIAAGENNGCLIYGLTERPQRRRRNRASKDVEDKSFKAQWRLLSLSPLEL